MIQVSEWWWARLRVPLGCWLLMWVTAGYWCGLLLVTGVGYCWLLMWVTAADNCWLLLQITAGYWCGLLLVTDVGYCWLLMPITAGYWCGLLLVTAADNCWLLLQITAGYWCGLLLVTDADYCWLLMLSVACISGWWHSVCMCTWLNWWLYPCLPLLQCGQQKHPSGQTWCKYHTGIVFGCSSLLLSFCLT